MSGINAFFKSPGIKPVIEAWIEHTFSIMSLNFTNKYALGEWPSLPQAMLSYSLAPSALFNKREGNDIELRVTRRMTLLRPESDTETGNRFFRSVKFKEDLRANLCINAYFKDVMQTERLVNKASKEFDLEALREAAPRYVFIEEVSARMFFKHIARKPELIPACFATNATREDVIRGLLKALREEHKLISAKTGGTVVHGTTEFRYVFLYNEEMIGKGGMPIMIMTVNTTKKEFLSVPTACGEYMLEAVVSRLKLTNLN
ncbi:hypothetical protein SPFM1_00195 [Salmonella phage SPFM1]|nr:hypothetical protein SPFM1_00195 [Salmonella phage SPFM1]